MNFLYISVALLSILSAPLPKKVTNQIDSTLVPRDVVLDHIVSLDENHSALNKRNPFLGGLVAKVVGKEATKVVAKETTKAVAKSVVKGAAKSAVKGAAKSAVKGAAKSTAKSASKSIAKSAAKTVSKSTAKTASKTIKTPKVKTPKNQVAKKQDTKKQEAKKKVAKKQEAKKQDAKKQEAKKQDAKKQVAKKQVAKKQAAKKQAAKKAAKTQNPTNPTDTQDDSNSKIGIKETIKEAVVFNGVDAATNAVVNGVNESTATTEVPATETQVANPEGQVVVKSDETKEAIPVPVEQPSQSADPVQPVDNAPADPVQPVDNAPADPVQPVDNAPADPVQPVDNAPKGEPANDNTVNSATVITSPESSDNAV